MNNELKIWEGEDKLKTIKTLFAKNLNNEEFVTLVGIGKATGLNPFLREIWAVKFGNSPANIFVGRDGYRKSAQSHKAYDYHSVDAVYENDVFKVKDGVVEHSYDFKSRGKIVGAYCVVARKGSSKPCYNFVDFGEYNTNKSVWATKPATMIKKVAEAQGLRGAFQELFAGTYEESENWADTKTPYSKEELTELASAFNTGGIDLGSQTLKDQHAAFNIKLVLEKIQMIKDIYEGNQLITDDDVDRIWNESE